MEFLWKENRDRGKALYMCEWASFWPNGCHNTTLAQHTPWLTSIKDTNPSTEHGPPIPTFLLLRRQDVISTIPARMASERESRIDLGRLGTQPRGGQTETKHNAGVSTNTPAQNRLKRKIPQQGETSNGKTITALSKKSKSPWTGYNKLYSLQFGASDYFQVAEEIFKRDSKSDQSPVVIVKSFSNTEARTCMQYIQRINHKNFVPVRNFFSTNGESFVAFEFMPLSLSELAGHPLMNDFRLASILGQVSH